MKGIDILGGIALAVGCATLMIVVLPVAIIRGVVAGIQVAWLLLDD